MRLLMCNLAMDLDDPVLEFAVGWASALATRVDFVHLITMRMGRVDVPKNVRVYSVGKERGYSEPHRGIEFYRHLFRILREDRIDVCFSHMIPIFTVLAAPVLKARKIPIVTWYAHPSLSLTLKLAHHLSERMVTSVATAYPYKDDKLTVVGQGIDTNLFVPSGTPPDKSTIILCVGRLSRAKNHPTLLKAAAMLHERWGKTFHLVIVGGLASPKDEAYARSLHAQVQVLGLQNIVRFESPVPSAKLVSWYHRCSVHVNLTPTGSGDKVALEAMSCGRPCLAANDGFRDTFGDHEELLRFRYSAPGDLAAKLEVLLELSSETRQEIGLYLREKVVQLHGLNRLVDRLVLLFQELNRESKIVI